MQQHCSERNRVTQIGNRISEPEDEALWIRSYKRLTPGRGSASSPWATFTVIWKICRGCLKSWSTMRRIYLLSWGIWWTRDRKACGQSGISWSWRRMHRYLYPREMWKNIGWRSSVIRRREVKNVSGSLSAGRKGTGDAACSWTCWRNLIFPQRSWL